MKIKSFLITLFMSFIVTLGFAQNSPVTDFVKTDQLYMIYNGHYIKFDDLKNSTVKKLFGKPLNIKNEKWEVNDAKNNRTYVYKNGELVFEDGVLSFIDIKKKGWFFAFKKGKKFSKPFSVGTSILELKKMFPVSFENKSNRLVYIQIDNCDCSISFTYSGNVITQLGFYTNES